MVEENARKLKRKNEEEKARKLKRKKEEEKARNLKRKNEEENARELKRKKVSLSKDVNELEKFTGIYKIHTYKQDTNNQTNKKKKHTNLKTNYSIFFNSYSLWVNILHWEY